MQQIVEAPFTVLGLTNPSMHASLAGIDLAAPDALQEDGYSKETWIPDELKQRAAQWVSNLSLACPLAFRAVPDDQGHAEQGPERSAC
jgi:hypothetical protein